MPEKMVEGLLAVGETCNSFLTGAGIPQCAAGLTCRSLGAGLGICVELSVEGDFCVTDSDCSGTTLYCNKSKGACEEPRDAGQSCKYVDPSLIQGAEESVRCKAPFVCDPDTEKCVKPCTKGYRCSSNDDCPGKLVCDRTGLASGYYSYFDGFCRDAFKNGDACRYDEECNSGYCTTNYPSVEGECARPLKEAGESCSPAAAFDATCASNYCGEDGTCAQECAYYGDSQCEDDEFCSTALSDVCVPRLADGSACSSDSMCMDGSWCDPYQMCAPQVANGQLCPNYTSRECKNGYCGAGPNPPYYLYECTPFLQAGDDCASLGSEPCGPDAFCRYDAAATPLYQCTPYGQVGDDCDYVYPYIPCAPDLTCNGDPAGGKCYEYGQFPNGSYCVSGAQCESGTCRQNACSGATTPLDGDCDTNNIDHAPCEAGTYCKTADEDTTDGSCKPQRRVGLSCLSRYFGRDCLGGSCESIHGGLYCGAGSIEPETLMCDGN